MVLTFAIPLRKWYNMTDLITMKHIDWMCKITLATGLIVFYGYILEMFYGMYSGDIYEIALVKYRLFGAYKWGYYALIFCNGVIPHIFWSPKARQNLGVVFIVCQFVSIGMWLERYIIIPVSLTHDFLPSSWGHYTPTGWDWGTFIGTIGQFSLLMFIFIRALPFINIFEIKEMKFLERGYSHKKHEDVHIPVAAE